jgi:hypothetical protein
MWLKRDALKSEIENKRETKEEEQAKKMKKHQGTRTTRTTEYKTRAWVINHRRNQEDRIAHKACTINGLTSFPRLAFWCRRASPI